MNKIPNSNLTFKNIEFDNEVHVKAILKLSKNNDYWVDALEYEAREKKFKSAVGYFLISPKFKVCGFIIFRHRGNDRIEYGQIEFLLIDKEYQRQGIGKKFLIYTMRVYRLYIQYVSNFEIDARYVMLDADNVPIMKFYKKCGFKSIPGFMCGNEPDINIEEYVSLYLSLYTDTHFIKRDDKKMMIIDLDYIDINFD